jgi:hypothetical protein
MRLHCQTDTSESISRPPKAVCDVEFRALLVVGNAPFAISPTVHTRCRLALPGLPPKA